MMLLRSDPKPCQQAKSGPSTSGDKLSIKRVVEKEGQVRMIETLMSLRLQCLIDLLMNYGAFSRAREAGPRPNCHAECSSTFLASYNRPSNLRGTSCPSKELQRRKAK